MRGGIGAVPPSDLPPTSPVSPGCNQHHLTPVRVFGHSRGGEGPYGTTLPPSPLVTSGCSGAPIALGQFGVRPARRPVRTPRRRSSFHPPPLLSSPLPNKAARCCCGSRHHAHPGCGGPPRGTVPHHGAKARYVGAAPRGVPHGRLAGRASGSPSLIVGLERVCSWPL